MTQVGGTEPAELLEYFESRKEEMLDALSKLVDMESSSEDLDAIDGFIQALQMYVETETGCDTEVVRNGPFGRPHLLARMGSRTDVLFIGHFDTVYKSGISEVAPFRVEGCRAYGAGVLDMKAGVVIMTEVARRIAHENPDANLTMFFESDEELGMFDSRHITTQLAVGAQLIIVFEFTTDETEVKIGSRGQQPYVITIHGKGGHAAYPEQLSNPIDVLCQIVARMNQLNEPEKGRVVVPTVVEAGRRINAVPETATLTLDVRYSDDSFPQLLEDTLESITFDDPNQSLSYEKLPRLPLYRANEDSYAFQLTRQCAKEFGLQLRGIEARGGSDINFAGEVNANVIEALGACGGNAHSAEREYVEIDSIARRAALSTLITRRALADAKALHQNDESQAVS
jgi:glutamate carboxypeptidase